MYVESNITPPRSLDQRMKALERANLIRSHRAQLKRDLKDGKVTVVDVLLREHELERSMKLYEVLLAVPKLGPFRIKNTMKSMQISSAKTVGGLTDRQINELLLRFDK